MQISRCKQGALSLAGAGALLLGATEARGATYTVGPGKTYPDLTAIERSLKPGDVVEVEGDATYPGGVIFREAGTEAAKITIRGVRKNGKRPVISGGRNTVEFRGDHYVFEGFEVTGGSARCVFHHAHDITLRDSVVHDCLAHGILGADEDSGSLTLSSVEVYHAGKGEREHQLYIATDETAHPGSVFRMEHCYIHDSSGGNSVKSRAERNEIYYNWIEGAVYHELELIGPDGQDPKRAREDSDIVGNVLLKKTPGFVIRVGGDGTGETEGRYRFVNNTIILGQAARAAFRLFNGLESVEMHNNVIAREGGGPVQVVLEQETRWVRGRPLIAGTNNWVPTGSLEVPTQWQNTRSGDDPGFVSWRDLRPKKDSPLIGAGATKLPSPPDCPFPRPLAAPTSLPPSARLETAMATLSRSSKGALDIGAFAYGAGETPAEARSVDQPPPPVPSTVAPKPLPQKVPPPWRGWGGCGGCALADEGQGAPFAAALAFAMLLLRRRRR